MWFTTFWCCSNIFLFDNVKVCVHFLGADQLQTGYTVSFLVCFDYIYELEQGRASHVCLSWCIWKGDYQSLSGCSVSLEVYIVSVCAKNAREWGWTLVQMQKPEWIGPMNIYKYNYKCLWSVKQARVKICQTQFKSKIQNLKTQRPHKSVWSIILLNASEHTVVNSRTKS